MTLFDKKVAVKLVCPYKAIKRLNMFGLENMCMQYESNQKSLAGLNMVTNHGDLALDFKVMKVELITEFVLENMCMQYKSIHKSVRSSLTDKQQ